MSGIEIDRLQLGVRKEAWIQLSIWAAKCNFRQGFESLSHGPILQTLIQPRYWQQGDNAVKEVRNAPMHKMFCLLTQQGYFTQCTGAHLEKGHTHEDVGGGECLEQ